MSALETLLEAARYVEMQELKLKMESPPPNKVPVSELSPQSSNNRGAIRIKKVDGVLPAITSPSDISPIAAMQSQRNLIRNSFDIINPLVIDEGGEARRKPPPMVFRSGTREVHNKLEKHRRAHLKECFDTLKRQLSPTRDEKKTSNLNILHSAIKCIHSLKKKEVELEQEMERLAREKIACQQRLALLKKDVSLHCDTDFPNLMPDSSATVQLHLPEGVFIKEEITDDFRQNGEITPMSSINELKLSKSITKVVSTNGIKEGIIPQTTQVQTTALSVVPIGYPMNQGLVLQKVIVPKGLTELSQLVTAGQPVAHFIATPQQLGGKVVPLVNQYVMKPLVVVSTPSRPS